MPDDVSRPLAAARAQAQATAPREPDETPTLCFRCGAAFGCGVAAAGCWCTRLPKLDPAQLAALEPQRRAALGLPLGALPASCLCPDCLAEIDRALRA